MTKKVLKLKIFKNKKLLIIVALAVVLLIGLAICNKMYKERYAMTAETKRIMQMTTDMLKKQSKVEKDLLKELKKGDFSFEDPLIVVDPYDFSPLTALVLFKSEVPLKVSVYIGGKDEKSAIEFTFDEYNKEHLIPIYGLYADTTNAVQLIGEDGEGKKHEQTMEIKTGPLNGELKEMNVKTEILKADQYQDGLNFTFDRKKSAFDIAGDIRWYFNYFQFLHSTHYEVDGNIFVSLGAFVDYGDSIIYEMNPLGKILNVYHSKYGIHHEIIKNKDGNLLVLGNNEDEKTIQDFIYEIDSKTGKVVNSLDLREVIKPERTSEFSNKEDWLHVNGLALNGDKLIVSSRNRSMIMQVSWPDGEVDWTLSEYKNAIKGKEDLALKPVGKTFEWFFSQHTPVVISNNNIMLFDNGGMRSSYNENTEKYSRIVQYKLDIEKREVSQVREFGKDLKGYFSPLKSSVSLLKNGNILGLFQTDTIEGVKYLELNEKNEVVWKANISFEKMKYEEYRTERYDLYNKQANDLKIGEKANNFIPRGFLNQVK